MTETDDSDNREKSDLGAWLAKFVTAAGESRGAMVAAIGVFAAFLASKMVGLANSIDAADGVSPVRLAVLLAFLFVFILAVAVAYKFAMLEFGKSQVRRQQGFIITKYGTRNLDGMLPWFGIGSMNNANSSEVRQDRDALPNGRNSHERPPMLTPAGSQPPPFQRAENHTPDVTMTSPKETRPLPKPADPRAVERAVETDAVEVPVTRRKR